MDELVVDEVILDVLQMLLSLSMCVCVCLLMILQYLIQSCLCRGRGIVEDMCLLTGCIHCGVEVTKLSTNKQHSLSLRETTSRGLCGLVCPSHTGERGGEGDCVKE